MAQLPSPDPQLLKLVDNPGNASSSDIAKARPVYIDGLADGNPTIADIPGLQDILEDFENRIAGLEPEAG